MCAAAGESGSPIPHPPLGVSRQFSLALHEEPRSRARGGVRWGVGGGGAGRDRGTRWPHSRVRWLAPVTPGLHSSFQGPFRTGWTQQPREPSCPLLKRAPASLLQVYPFLPHPLHILQWLFHSHQSREFSAGGGPAPGDAQWPVLLVSGPGEGAGALSEPGSKNVLLTTVLLHDFPWVPASSPV